MKATLINHMGDDLTVVNAARVSFAKESEWEDYEYYGSSMDSYPTTGKKLSSSDEGLLSFLARHNHWTPFAHPQVMLHLKMPLFVARQIDKHQIGFVVNEVSRRYVDDEPEFYTPEVWRKRAENVKQGSSDLEYTDRLDVGGVSGTVGEVIDGLYEDILQAYRQMLAGNCCPEQARMVLPQSMYTEQYKTGSLYAWSNLCKLRMDNHAQRETQELAGQIAEIMAGLFPISWKYLQKETE